MTIEPEEPDQPVAEQVAARLAAWREDALATLELVASYREHVLAQAQMLENPQAVLDYIDRFSATFDQASAAVGRITGELRSGATRAHVSQLNAVAEGAAADLPRCLVFRDKWINKPLPHERLRPLLNDISVTTRDQLVAFRDLAEAALAIDSLIEPERAPADEKKAFDRRALFTRLFKP